MSDTTQPIAWRGGLVAHRRRPAAETAATAGSEPAAAARPSGDSMWGLLAMFMLLACVVAAVVGAGPNTGSTSVGLFLVPVLCAIAAPLLVRVGRQERTFDLTGLLFFGLGLKLLSTFVRFAVVYDLYGGVADAPIYHEWGARLAPSFRSFDFTVDTGQKFPGTGTIRYITGLIYALTGSNEFAGFLVFSFLAFIGCVLFYMAFVTAVPDGNRKRYIMLLVLWPSLLFWPSSIGKESWMIFSLGLAALGSARLLAHRRGGIPMLAAGLGGMALLRPHMTLIVFGALFVGYMVRRSGTGGLGPLAKAGGIVMLLLVGTFVVAQTEEFFGVDELSGSSVSSTLDDTAEQTSQGGSSFTPPRVHSPLHYPWAFLTVVLRPFLFEAHNGQSLVSALEGMTLGLLLVLSLRRIRGLTRLLRRAPYALMCATFVLMFVYGFSSIGNFGILARQRTQMLPFLFVLVCLPAATRVVADNARRFRTAHAGIR